MNHSIFAFGLAMVATAAAQDFELPPGPIPPYDLAAEPIPVVDPVVDLTTGETPLVDTSVEETAPDDSATEDAAEPLEVPVVKAPNGFPQGSILPAPASLLDGLSIGASSSLVYDSSVDSGLGGAQNEGDLIFAIGPTLSYRSRGSLWNLGARTELNYSTYFDNSDLGGLGYSAALDIGYNGKPLTVRGSFGSSLTNGNNQYYGSYSESLNYNTSLSASYQWSAKTSFDARFGYSWTDPDEAVSATGITYGASENTHFDLSAMWQATPKVRIGPGVAWSWSGGDSQADRETVGPIIRLQYQLAQKVSMNGTFGVDFVDYAGAGGGDDTAFSTQFGINYRASRLWGMNLSILQGTTADGAAQGSYRESFSVRFGSTHRIRRATLALGLGYENSDSVGPGGTAFGSQVGDFMTFNASLGIPIFRQRVMASTFFDWRDEVGGGGNGENDGYRIGLGLSSSF